MRPGPVGVTMTPVVPVVLSVQLHSHVGTSNLNSGSFFNKAVSIMPSNLLAIVGTASSTAKAASSTSCCLKRRASTPERPKMAMEKSDLYNMIELSLNIV
jgi:hypothetical protein